MQRPRRPVGTTILFGRKFDEKRTPFYYEYTQHLIKCDLGRLYAHVDVLGKSTICLVALLLDSGTKLHELFGDILLCSFQHVNQSTKAS